MGNNAFAEYTLIRASMACRVLTPEMMTKDATEKEDAAFVCES